MFYKLLSARSQPSLLSQIKACVGFVRKFLPDGARFLLVGSTVKLLQAGKGTLKDLDLVVLLPESSFKGWDRLGPLKKLNRLYQDDSVVGQHYGFEWGTKPDVDVGVSFFWEETFDPIVACDARCNAMYLDLDTDEYGSFFGTVQEVQQDNVLMTYDHPQPERIFNLCLRASMHEARGYILNTDMDRAAFDSFENMFFRSERGFSKSFLIKKLGIHFINHYGSSDIAGFMEDMSYFMARLNRFAPQYLDLMEESIAAMLFWPMSFESFAESKVFVQKNLSYMEVDSESGSMDTEEAPFSPISDDSSQGSAKTRDLGSPVEVQSSLRREMTSRFEEALKKKPLAGIVSVFLGEYRLVRTDQERTAIHRYLISKLVLRLCDAKSLRKSLIDNMMMSPFPETSAALISSMVDIFGPVTSVRVRRRVTTFLNTVDVPVDYNQLEQFPWLWKSLYQPDMLVHYLRRMGDISGDRLLEVGEPHYVQSEEDESKTHVGLLVGSEFMQVAEKMTDSRLLLGLPCYRCDVRELDHQELRRFINCLRVGECLFEKGSQRTAELVLRYFSGIEGPLSFDSVQACIDMGKEFPELFCEPYVNLVVDSLCANSSVKYLKWMSIMLSSKSLSSSFKTKQLVRVFGRVAFSDEEVVRRFVGVVGGAKSDVFDPDDFLRFFACQVLDRAMNISWIKAPTVRHWCMELLKTPSGKKDFLSRLPRVLNLGFLPKKLKMLLGVIAVGVADSSGGVLPRLQGVTFRDALAQAEKLQSEKADICEIAKEDLRAVVMRVFMHSSSREVLAEYKRSIAGGEGVVVPGINEKLVSDMVDVIRSADPESIVRYLEEEPEFLVTQFWDRLLSVNLPVSVMTSVYLRVPDERLLEKLYTVSSSEFPRDVSSCPELSAQVISGPCSDYEKWLFSFSADALVELIRENPQIVLHVQQWVGHDPKKRMTRFVRHLQTKSSDEKFGDLVSSLRLIWSDEVSIEHCPNAWLDVLSSFDLREHDLPFLFHAFTHSDLNMAQFWTEDRVAWFEGHIRNVNLVNLVSFIDKILEKLKFSNVDLLQRVITHIQNVMLSDALLKSNYSEAVAHYLTFLNKDLYPGVTMTVDRRMFGVLVRLGAPFAAICDPKMVVLEDGLTFPMMVMDGMKMMTDEKDILAIMKSIDASEWALESPALKTAALHQLGAPINIRFLKLLFQVHPQLREDYRFEVMEAMVVSMMVRGFMPETPKAEEYFVEMVDLLVPEFPEGLPFHPLRRMFSQEEIDVDPAHLSILFKVFMDRGMRLDSECEWGTLTGMPVINSLVHVQSSENGDLVAGIPESLQPVALEVLSHSRFLELYEFGTRLKIFDGRHVGLQLDLVIYDHFPLVIDTWLEMMDADVGNVRRFVGNRLDDDGLGLQILSQMVYNKDWERLKVFLRHLVSAGYDISSIFCKQKLSTILRSPSVNMNVFEVMVRYMNSADDFPVFWDLVQEFDYDVNTGSLEVLLYLFERKPEFIEVMGAFIRKLSEEGMQRGRLFRLDVETVVSPDWAWIYSGNILKSAIEVNPQWFLEDLSSGTNLLAAARHTKHGDVAKAVLDPLFDYFDRDPGFMRDYISPQLQDNSIGLDILPILVWHAVDLSYLDRFLGLLSRHCRDLMELVFVYQEVPQLHRGVKVNLGEFLATHVSRTREGFSDLAQRVSRYGVDMTQGCPLFYSHLLPFEGDEPANWYMGFVDEMQMSHHAYLPYGGDGAQVSPFWALVRSGNYRCLGVSILEDWPKKAFTKGGVSLITAAIESGDSTTLYDVLSCLKPESDFLVFGSLYEEQLVADVLATDSRFKHVYETLGFPARKLEWELFCKGERSRSRS